MSDSSVSLPSTVSVSVIGIAIADEFLFWYLANPITDTIAEIEPTTPAVASTMTHAGICRTRRTIGSFTDIALRVDIIAFRVVYVTEGGTI